ncbi:MAG: sensor histidine kinase [Oscillospiraceae bacterium]
MVLLIIIFAVLSIALLFKIYLLRKAAKELSEGISERLESETNTLIGISSRDRAMLSLANTVNVQLAALRDERHRYRQGDMELKNAVTNISHDLRTPLTAILGYLELLAKEEKSDSAERYISVIQERAESLKKLTEELFRYSVILSTKEYEEEPIDLKGALEESIAAFYTALNERGIVPNVKLPEDKVVRLLDRAALSRVFSNLLQNVIKYSDGDLNVILTEAGHIEFSNTAVALNEVQIGRLFDRFYTVEDARNATGLGLSIARALVEQMHGTICAKYEESKLYITIFFPS